MEKKIYREKARVTAKKNQAEGLYKLSLYSPRIAAIAKPGQFVEVKVGDGLDPLLRRPLGVHRVSRSNFEILFERVGKATGILAATGTGAVLDVIGPLGNGFSAIQGYDRAVIVAGGMGIAPLAFLAQKKALLGNAKAAAYIGARSREKLSCLDEFRKQGIKVAVSTDDGSRGHKGKVTDMLHDLLARKGNEKIYLYACGPRPMLKEVSLMCSRYGIPAEVSLEEHMACGIGICQGCIVRTVSGMKRVCTEGPVFRADEIIW